MSVIKVGRMRCLWNTHWQEGQCDSDIQTKFDLKLEHLAYEVRQLQPSRALASVLIVRHFLNLEP